MEQQRKDLEARRTQLVFTLEKERSVWNQDSEALANQVQDLRDQLRALEMQRDPLKRDNDKLKAHQTVPRLDIAASQHMLNYATGASLPRFTLTTSASMAQSTFAKHRGSV